MSIPITPDHFCVSADEPAVRLQLLARLLEQLTDTVITVTTPARPDGITLTVLAHEPHHQPWQLYGAAFIDEHAEQPGRERRVFEAEVHVRDLAVGDVQIGRLVRRDVGDHRYR